jgi:hypothetical protein
MMDPAGDRKIACPRLDPSFVQADFFVLLTYWLGAERVGFFLPQVPQGRGKHRLLDSRSPSRLTYAPMEVDFKEMYKQAQQLQARIKEIQEQLARKSVTVDTGGGMVTVTVNGRQELVSIKLDPLCVDPRDVPCSKTLS